MHDELTGDLSRMAAQLKLNSQSFGDTLAKDDKVISNAMTGYIYIFPIDEFSFFFAFRYYKMLNKLLPTTWIGYARRERDWMSITQNLGGPVL